jgi:lysine 2,3-aminomutase
MNKATTFTVAQVEELMVHHGLGEDAKQIIRNENLLPPSLLARMHNNYPQHSMFSVKSRNLFAQGKNKYSGLSGFREVLAILEKNGIVLTHVKERELFVEVYAFLATKHVLDTIDWDNFEKDPVFQLVIPQPNMIEKSVVAGYEVIEDDAERMKYVVGYRNKTNPHDGKQLLNRPSFQPDNGEWEAIDGGQHKYPPVFLLLDKTTQGCFAYCTYCFRHAQVRGDDDMFIQDDVVQVQNYWRMHKEITDILITGGDAGYMPTYRFEAYLKPIMEDPELSHIRTIRIASRALTYEPGVVVSPHWDKTIELLKQVIDHGIQVIWVAHFSTPKELMNIHTLAAVRRLRANGIRVRSQSPVMNHISLYMNEDGSVDVDKTAQNWIDIGNIFMMLGITFHSMYCARPTGEHDYFTSPLADMDKVFTKVYQTLPSVGRPTRFITMTSSAGKTSLLGTTTVNGEKAFVLKFNESRNMKWMDTVFLAKYDEKENTIEKLIPFDSDKYFYEDELKEIEKHLEDDFYRYMRKQEKVKELIKVE